MNSIVDVYIFTFVFAIFLIVGLLIKGIAGIVKSKRLKKALDNFSWYPIILGSAGTALSLFFLLYPYLSKNAKMSAEQTIALFLIVISFIGFLRIIECLPGKTSKEEGSKTPYLPRKEES
jgi:hypothetical protein